MQNMTTSQLTQLLTHFNIEGTPVDIRPLGTGLINDTFMVITSDDSPHDYVLQRINHNIFTDIDLLQRNIEAVTGHIRAKLLAQGEPDIDRRVLQFVTTQDGKTYYRTPEGQYWRVSVFIPRTQGFDEVTPSNAYDAGKAFGQFESMLTDLDVPLGETIPHFHDMTLRTQQLQQAIDADKAGRLAEVRTLVDHVMDHAHDMCLADRLYQEGKLPKRICHCDTKVSNVLFDAAGGVLCVIDLDTTMPSFVFSDYGDFLRTAGSTSAEDDPDASHDGLRWEVIEHFTKGYIEGTSHFLTPLERSMLPFAMSLFPYMQCVRFLTDYLNGDTYYKIRYATHNLDRANNQYRLFLLTLGGQHRLTKFIEAL